MILEHGLEGTSALWNTETNTYDIRQRTQYRWLDHKNIPKSGWYTDISDALQWIIDYDREKVAI